jgi:type IV secretory pathway TrbD component
VPVSVTRALDPDALIDGARAALLANGTIATALNTASNPGRIANEMVAQGTTPPYIVLALASTVYESPYGEAVINALMDVSCYTQGASTTLVRQLIVACVAALVDTAWTATGFALWSVSMEESGSGIRSVTSVDSSGVITRGRQITVRIRAMKV